MGWDDLVTAGPKCVSGQTSYGKIYLTFTHLDYHHHTVTASSFLVLVLISRLSLFRPALLVLRDYPPSPPASKPNRPRQQHDTTEESGIHTRHYSLALLCTTRTRASSQRRCRSPFRCVPRSPRSSIYHSSSILHVVHRSSLSDLLDPSTPYYSGRYVPPRHSHSYSHSHSHSRERIQRSVSVSLSNSWTTLTKTENLTWNRPFVFVTKDPPCH